MTQQFHSQVYTQKKWKYISTHRKKTLHKCSQQHYLCELKSRNKDFLGGTLVKNLPANAGDMGSIPGPGKSHQPWSNKARVPQLLSLHSRAPEPQLLSPWATTTEAHSLRAHAPWQEKPPQWEAPTPQRRVAPTRLNYRKPTRSTEDPTQPKFKN